MKLTVPQAELGRSDLLRALAVAGNDPARARRYAEILGFDPVPRLPDVAADKRATKQDRPLTPPSGEASMQLTPRYPIRLFGLLEPPEVDELPPAADLPTASAGLDAEDCEPRQPMAAVRLLPLVPHGRLWPALKALILSPVDAGLDVSALTRRLAEAKPLDPLPRRLRWRRADDVLVVLDRARHLAPLAADLGLVAAELQHLAGQSGFRLCMVDGHPARVIACRGGRGRRQCDKLPLPRHARVIVISDLGSARGRPNIAQQHAWLDWLRALRGAGSIAWVVSPVSAQSLDLRIAHSLAGGALQPTGGHAARLSAKPRGALDAALRRLKTALACAVQVEPELLRAMRLADPALAPYPELESRWYQDEERRFSPYGELKPAAAASYRHRFEAWPVDDQRRVLRVLREQHGGEYRSIEMLEILLWAGHATEVAKQREREAITESERWFAGFDHDRARQQDTALVRNFARSVWDVVAHDTRVQARYSKWLVPLWAVDARRRAQSPPAGLNPADVASYTSTPPVARNCWLMQDGDTLLAQGEEAGAGQSAIAGPLPTRGIELRQGGVQRVFDYTGARLALASLSAGEIELGLDRARLRVGELAVPWWTLEAGRDRQGAYVLMPVFRGPPARVALPLPDVDPLRVEVAVQGEVMQRQMSDAIGPYADVSVRGVTQRLRWIPPGEFLMGSPDDEPKRFDDEGPRHRVILTEGFWLADTACTQALWQAVMGDNPSSFKDDPEWPVESVSWDDTQAFLNKLGELVGAEAALPSEAEWEYACRAGTQTPFWWGAVLTTDDANYDGDRPYHDGPKGEDRQRTVPVKTFRPNPWGLWQMHGNVWEWCRDGLRRYGPEPVVAPAGPDQGDRALRGGSWLRSGRYLRSAYRLGFGPGYRDGSFGFRFLLRSQAEGPEGRE